MSKSVGREIDVLVAKHVFKTRIQWKFWGDQYHPFNADRGGIFSIIKHYSSTWEGMGLIFEKLKGFEPALEWDGEVWKASFINDEASHIIEVADTAPMAVAFATLKVYGVDVDG